MIFAIDYHGTFQRDAAKAAGFDVDVWLDDQPEYVAEQEPRCCVGMRAKAEGTT